MSLADPPRLAVDLFVRFGPCDGLAVQGQFRRYDGVGSRYSASSWTAVAPEFHLSGPDQEVGRALASMLLACGTEGVSEK